MTTSDMPSAPAPPIVMRWLRLSGPMVLAGNVAVLAALVIAGWPEWWLHINYERSPLTWFSSVQLLALGVVAAASAGVVHVLGERGPEARSQVRWWLALAAAMFFLALDERFQFHERLREGIFKPHHIGTELPGIAAGDFLLALYALAGLAVAWRLWRFLQGERVARAYFVAALVLALAATVLDVGDWGKLSLEAARREQFVEEILETLAEGTLLAAFTRYLLRLCAGVKLVPR